MTASTLRFYVNGTQVSSVARTGSIPTSTNPLQIGSDSIYGQYFNGLIDEVRIYNTALSAAQIQTDMTTPVGGRPPPPDTTPPTDPSALSATAAGTTVNLSWTRLDRRRRRHRLRDRALPRHRLHQLHASSKTVTTTTTSDTGLTANTTYSYRVRATDATPNFSGYSNTATATTPAPDNTTADRTRATSPRPQPRRRDRPHLDRRHRQRLRHRLPTSSAAKAPAAPPSTRSQPPTAPPPPTTTPDLTPNTSYSYRVRATDAAANQSPLLQHRHRHHPRRHPTTNRARRTLPRPRPGSSRINLAWTASTDAGGVTGYEVERCQGAGCTNFTPLKTVTTTTTSDTGLAASTTYSYRVRAKDATPNFSGYSNTATATTPAAGGTSGLVAAYGFDEGSGVSVADSSGNGLTGTVANGSWSAAGKFGKALSFNGTSSRVTVPDAAALDLTTGMTLEAWVNPAVAPTGWRTSSTRATTTTTWRRRRASGNRPVGGAIIGGSQSQAFGTARSRRRLGASGRDVSTAATLRFYVNGTQVSSVARTGSILTSTNPLQIGSDSIYGQYFNGLIDEVRIYNTALSAAQIQTDMATPVGPSTPPPPDTTPPTDPSALSATAAGTTVNLSWTGSTDAGGVTGYEIERCQGTGCTNFTLLKTVTTTTTSDTGLTPNTTYSYRVRAKDATPNYSGYTQHRHRHHPRRPRHHAADRTRALSPRPRPGRR